MRGYNSISAKKKREKGKRTKKKTAIFDTGICCCCCVSCDVINKHKKVSEIWPTGDLPFQPFWRVGKYLACLA